MYAREDFATTIDYVTYKVTGKVRNLKKEKTTIPITEAEPVMTITPRNKLKFYNQPSGNRLGVVYNSKFLCGCAEDEKNDVQKYFDEHYNGDFEQIKEDMKNRYNIGKKVNTLQNAELHYSKPKNRRVRVTINLNGKTKYICTCDSYQKKKVKQRFNELRSVDDLESIKRTMQKEFSTPSKTVKREKRARIVIYENGDVKYNGQTIPKGEGFYDLVQGMMNKEV